MKALLASTLLATPFVTTTPVVIDYKGTITAYDKVDGQSSVSLLDTLVDREITGSFVVDFANGPALQTVPSAGVATGFLQLDLSGASFVSSSAQWSGGSFTSPSVDVLNPSTFKGDAVLGDTHFGALGQNTIQVFDRAEAHGVDAWNRQLFAQSVHALGFSGPLFTRAPEDAAEALAQPVVDLATLSGGTILQITQLLDGSAEDSQLYTQGRSILFDIESATVRPFTASTVPEPDTLALLGVGLIGVGFARRKKRTVRA